MLPRNACAASTSETAQAPPEAARPGCAGPSRPRSPRRTARTSPAAPARTPRPGRPRGRAGERVHLHRDRHVGHLLAELGHRVAEEEPPVGRETRSGRTSVSTVARTERAPRRGLTGALTRLTLSKCREISLSAAGGPTYRGRTRGRRWSEVNSLRTREVALASSAPASTTEPPSTGMWAAGNSKQSPDPQALRTRPTGEWAPLLEREDPQRLRVVCFPPTAVSWPATVRREPLHRPARRRTAVAQPVVQPAEPALPELDPLRHHAETAPVLRPRHVPSPNRSAASS